MSVGLPRKRIVGESFVSSEGGTGRFVRGNSVNNKGELESIEHQICQKCHSQNFRELNEGYGLINVWIIFRVTKYLSSCGLHQHLYIWREMLLVKCRCINGNKG